MRAPSRTMAKRARLDWFGTGAVIMLLAGILMSPGAIWWPLALVLPSLLAIGFWHHEQRLRRLALARSGGGICQFARSFSRAGLDTWIIRATYEELADRFPVRADDSFEHDLLIDAEDVDDIATAIAERACRTMKLCEQNPLYGRVTTVRDLVAFLHYQPTIRIT